MFGTIRISTRPDSRRDGQFIAHMVKENKDVTQDELFGPISEKVLRDLDLLEDDHELLVQEDKVLHTRQTEISPIGGGAKKSATRPGY